MVRNTKKYIMYKCNKKKKLYKIELNVLEVIIHGGSLKKKKKSYRKRTERL